MLEVAAAVGTASEEAEVVGVAEATDVAWRACPGAS